MLPGLRKRGSGLFFWSRENEGGGEWVDTYIGPYGQLGG